MTMLIVAFRDWFATTSPPHHHQKKLIKWSLIVPAGVGSNEWLIDKVVSRFYITYIRK
jgi:hypothetical protein